MKRTGAGASIALIAAAVLLAIVLLAVGWAVLFGEPASPGVAGRDAATLKEIEEVHRAAEHYIKTDQADKARPIVEKLLEKYPEDPEGHVLMAKILMVEENGDEAYEHLNRSLKLDPAQDEVQFLAGVLAEKLGDHDKARFRYGRAAELDPADPRYPTYLGQLLMKLNELDEAQLRLLTAVKLDAARPEPYGLLAEVSARRGKLDMAISQVNKALDQIEPDDRRRVPYTLQKAALLRRANEPAAALRVLRDLGGEQQLEQRIVEQVALCHQMMGRHEEAAREWAALFAHDPANAEAAAQAGLCFKRAGRLRQARRYLDLARRANPEDPTAKMLEEALRKALANEAEAAASDDERVSALPADN